MKTKGAKNKKGVKKILNKWGYYEIFKPEHQLAKKNGYIREHRMVAYDAGLIIKPSDEVHHINGIKTDNRLENLEVMSKEKHTSITWKGKKRGVWSEERRRAKSIQMKSNKNWKGNIYSNPELINQSHE